MSAESTARAWISADPDPANRAEMELLLAGDSEVLKHRVGRRLEFGTAGLRGAMGAGPDRMNQIVVAQTASAIGAWLPADSHVVIGHDARHGSQDFAAVSARLLEAGGHRVSLFAGPIPTPLAVWAGVELDVDSVIVVTASHNPATDNGYKVYAPDGAQIGAVDAEAIEAKIDPDPAVARANIDAAPPVITMIDPTPVGHSYLRHIDRGVAKRPRRVVYTAMHGVAGSLGVEAMRQHGHDVVPVEAQFDPDPDFPTAPFPNPEEPGALDLAVATATDCDADLVIAHDPDGDRLAVAVPSDGQWRALTGDEVGILLGDHLLGRRPHATPALVASTAVSSTLMGKIAAHHGAAHVITATGFKHLARAGDDTDEPLVFAYEEALGYSVDALIRDKDGISAAIVLLELAGELAQQGTTLVNAIEQLHRTHGAHVTGQVSHRFATLDPMTDMAAMVDGLRTDPPAMIASLPVTAVSEAFGVLNLHVGESRIAIRASGTEPKVKFYIEAAAATTTEAGRLLHQLTDAVSTELI